MTKVLKPFLVIFMFLLIHSNASAEVPVVDDSENYALLNEQSNELLKSDEAGEDFEPTDSTETLDKIDPDWGEPLVSSEQIDVAEDNNNQALTTHVKDHNSNIEDNAVLLDKVQTLQEEVQQLRGQLEVQSHDLKMLQEQQLAFYKDLDARISQNGDKPPLEMNQSPTHDIKSQVKHSSASKKDNINPADEQISYLKAYELIKNKNYDEALKAMTDFATQYPQSGYTPNAQYWLGELYLQKKQFEKATQHFDVVIEKYPSSNKTAPSLLKLAYAQAGLGEKEKARQTLNQVIQNFPDTDTAQLATAKLNALK